MNLFCLVLDQKGDVGDVCIYICYIYNTCVTLCCAIRSAILLPFLLKSFLAQRWAWFQYLRVEIVCQQSKTINV